jgi:uncharacterized protein YjcR
MRSVYGTAEEIAAWLAIPVRTVHRWASEDQWKRDNSRRPVLYNCASAANAYARREQARTETLNNIATGRDRRLAS